MIWNPGVQAEVTVAFNHAGHQRARAQINMAAGVVIFFFKSFPRCNGLNLTAVDDHTAVMKCCQIAAGQHGLCK